MKPRSLQSDEIKAHGPCASDNGGTRTVFKWAKKMGFGKTFESALRTKIHEAEQYCCFGATNNPGVLASCFNEVLEDQL